MKEIESKKIRTYEVERDNKTYHVYTCINDDDREYTNFYIHNIEYGIIEFMIGLKCDAINTEEKIIDGCIDEWIEDYSNEYED